MAAADPVGQGPHVVVVGAGLAGLTAAFTLVTAGAPSGEAPTGGGGRGLQVSVLEADGRVGGKVHVSDVAGVPVDEGAESALARTPALAELADAVGLGPALVAPATTAAGIWSRGRVHPMPARQVMGVPADLGALARTGLLTPAELARTLADPACPGAPLDADVAVGEVVARRMGHAVVDRLVEPLLGGVYAGHARRLSLQATVPALYDAARRTGVLLDAAARVAPPPPPRRPRAARPAGLATGTGPGRADRPAPARPSVGFLALAGGLGRLPAALAAAATARGVRLSLGHPVRALRRTPTGWALVVGDADGGPERVVGADAVVLAVPAGPAARLLAPVAPGAAALLAGIEYASVGVLTLAFPGAALPGRPRGSGLLVPPVEGRLVKAVTFSSAKWGWYAGAAPGMVLVRLSVGRHGEAGVLDRDDADLVDAAVADLARLTPVHGAPLDARVTRWPDGLPQYAVGHVGRVASLRAELAAHPGLALAGAAYDGVGLPAVITAGRTAAGQVLAWLPTRRKGENV